MFPARMPIISQPPSASLPTFTSTWTTTGSDETVAIPLTNHASFEEIVIDWGDGSAKQTVSAYNDDLDGGSEGGVDHDYATAATYTIGITGNIYGLKFANGGDKAKIKTISEWGNFKLSDQDTFYGCSNLTISATDAPGITTTTFRRTFKGCAALTTLVTDGSGTGDAWDTSSVTNFTDVFSGCTNFNSSVDHWNVAAGTDFTNLFYAASSYNQSMSSWSFKTSGSIYFTSMFDGASAFNQDVRTWNTERVIDMGQLFSGCANFTNGGQDLTEAGNNWDVQRVTNMANLFKGTAMNGDVTDWTVTVATTMDSMFESVTEFNQDLSDWDTAAVANMKDMFKGATSYVGTGADSFDIADVTNMTDMFNGANALTTANYNALLIAWEGQTEQDDVTFHAGDATYTGSTAIAARAALVDSGWTITDGGEG